MILFHLLLVLCSVAAEDDDDAVVVNVQQGSLAGARLANSVNAGNYYAFFNVPYANKPIGEKRFKEPEEPLPWDGVRDAKEEGNACLSLNPIFQSVEGDEDCLYLNVYTPKKPSELQDSPLPVMVWIHGGAFHIGSNSPLYYGPDFLMMEDVVLVVINYRLNVFGFLSMQNAEVPGNNGLKDQVMALKWVQANIGAFGGDPRNVTVFGESAGGASVHFLMLSPMAKGLFHRAIAQSGTALNPWAMTKFTTEAAALLGKVFDCNVDNATELVACLRAADAEELVKYQYNIVSPKLTEALKYMIFLPCVEPPEAENPFLPQDPRQIILQGQVADVPFMLGTMQSETLFLNKVLTGNLIPDKVKETLFSTANKNPEWLLVFKLDDIPEESKKRIGDGIRKFYFEDLPISENTIPNVINVTTDLEFLLGVHDAVFQQVKHATSPIYQYYFTLETGYGQIKNFLGGPIKGPSHGDDVGYLFYMSIAPQDTDPEGDGYKSMRKIVKLWTNFAKFGNPTPDTSLDVEWKPATVDHKHYLEIGDEFVMREDVEKKRMDFWDAIRLQENVDL